MNARFTHTLTASLLGMAVSLAGGMTAHAQHYHRGGGHWHGGGQWHSQSGHFHGHGHHSGYRGKISGYYTPSYQQYNGYHSSPSHQSVGTPHVTGYRFGSLSHVDDLAQQLEREANRLCLELHYNYQHNPGFRETYREAYEILTTARYIHGLEHSGNREKLRQVAGELDSLFHHVQDDVASWTGHDHRHVSPGGLSSKLRSVEDTLHHLMDDIGVKSRF